MTLSHEFYMRPSTGLAMLVALLTLGGCATSTPHIYDPDQEIEILYSGPGPYTVTTIGTPAIYGQPGGALYVPEGHDGRAPLVVWQNGTGEPIRTYDAIARHLASWGMVVIGSDDRQMATGERAMAMLANVTLWTMTSDHPLFGRVAVENFALVGSSQGAVSTINAHTQFETGRGATALAIHGTPTEDAIDFFRLDMDYDAGAVTAPTLILTGTEDEFISPLWLNRALFEGMRGPGLRVLAVANGADHIEFANDAGRFRGYLTAWLLFQLLNDPHAAQGFIGRSEIMSNPSWSVADVSQ
jgi:alpha-beta hydrolase superfamily lysophospholipase